MLLNNSLRRESQVFVCACMYICTYVYGIKINRTLIEMSQYILNRNEMICILNYCLPFTNLPKTESKPICFKI